MGVKIPVDFSNVESNTSVRVPPGDYVVKIVKVEKGESSQKKTPGLYVTFEFASGPKDVRGKRIQDRHWLTPQSLWTLRNMLEAIGYNVPSSTMKLDADKMLKGKKVGISVGDGDEYKGKIRSEVGDYIPVSAVGNMTDTSTASADDDDDEWGDEDEDDLVDEPEDEADDEDEDEEEDEVTWEDDNEEDDEEDDEDDEDEDDLSFDEDDLADAKGPALKEYLAEAVDAGYEFDLPAKPKVSQVREALLSIFEDEDDEDEMEEFDLDDMD